MLDELYVDNLGILRTARIEPGPGLVAITGETGTGKTLLLGALRLLRGDAARSDQVGPHGDEARAEGRFTIGPTETVVARRVADGKSRAYLDGGMVPAKALAERLDALVEIVAQHEHVALGREASVRRLVDGLLDATGRAAVSGYREAWSRLTALRADRQALGGDPRSLARDLDLLLHEAGEIEGAGLVPGEDDDLRVRLGRLRHAGELTEALGSAAGLLDDEGGATDIARTALGAIESAARVDPGLADMADRLRGTLAEMDELARDLRITAGEVDHDPAALARTEERAALVAALKRRFGSSVDEVIAYGRRAADRATAIQQQIARAETIDADLAAAEEAAQSAGAALAIARRDAGKHLADGALEHLRQLGFREPVLSVDVDPAPPGPHGADRVRLVFSSDAGLTPGPVSRVASGGELSRLVLAVRVAGGVADAEVLAFDEIDAGVGGSTALAMGELLSRLATGRQVFVVTHLPQVAAFADTHFVVERSGTEAVVRRLDGDDRIAEVARMLGGIGDSDAGRTHATELMSLATMRRTS